MGLRLALQPPWVRFLVWAPIGAVLFGGGTRLMSRSIWSTVIVAIVFGVFLAASFTYGTQRMYTALTEAVGGLDQAERSQAIAAVTHGVVPADQRCGPRRSGLAGPTWVASPLINSSGRNDGTG